MADESPVNGSMRFGNVRRGVTQQQVGSDGFALGDGKRFWAIRFYGENSPALPVELQWEKQSFDRVATKWESFYSPLMGHGGISFLIPVVDMEGEVIAYYARTVPRQTLMLRQDGTYVFDRITDPKNEVTAGSRSGFGPAAYPEGSIEIAIDVVVDIDGVLVSELRTGVKAEPSLEAISFEKFIVEWVVAGAVFGAAFKGLRIVVARVITVGGRTLTRTLMWHNGVRVAQRIKKTFTPSASVRGILEGHLEKLKQLAKLEKSVYVIRASKEKALQWIGKRQYVSKPFEVKLKSDLETGLVKSPIPIAKNASIDELKQLRPGGWDSQKWHEWIVEWKKLEKAKYTFDERGFLLTPEGKYVFSDYDILGKYRLVTRQGKTTTFEHWQYDDAINTRDGLGKLNHAVVGHDGAMFRHAGQDTYVLYKGGRFVRGLETKEDDLVLVVDEGGSHFYFNGPSELKEYYLSKGIDSPQGRIR